MKQTFVTTLALVLVCSTQLLAAETNAPAGSQKMKIVPSLGYTYFNIQGSSNDFKSKGGSSAAVLAQLPIDQDWEFETGLEYIETGAKMSESFGFVDLDYATLTITSLAVPIRMKYSFNAIQNEGTHWYGKAGLTPAFVMSAKMDTIVGSGDVKSDLNTVNFLTQAGIGADWGVGMGGRINFDVLYNYGLNKVMKDDDGRSVGFHLQAGYSIEI